MGSKTTTTQSNSPYKPAQPYIDANLNRADDLYKSGGFQVNPYSGDMVANETWAEAEARRRIQETSASNIERARVMGSDLDAIRSTNLGGDALASGVQDSLDRGMNFGFTDQFNYGVNTAQDGTMNERFRETMEAQSDPNSYYDARDNLRQNVIETIMPGMNATFAGGGMTGSGLHQQNLAKGLATGLAPIEYEMDKSLRDRAMAAASALQGADETAKARALQAGVASQDAALSAGQYSLSASEIAQRMKDNNEAQAMQAAGMLPQALQAEYMVTDQLRQAGEAQRKIQQDEVNAKVLQDYQEQTAAANALKDYMNVVNQTGGQFSSSTATQQTKPGLFQVLGTGLKLFGV